MLLQGEVELACSDGKELSAQLAQDVPFDAGGSLATSFD